MRRLGPGLVALVLAAAAAVAAAPPARAADMAPAPGYYPPPVYRPALYDWTGIYIGGHLGGAMLADTVTQTTTTAGFLSAGTTTDLHPWGFLGGGQIGANYEFAPWVVGVEGAFTGSAITGNATIPTPLANTTQRSTDNPQWFATATGRLGYAANTYLFYVKGGAAWMHAEYTQDTLVGGFVNATQPLSETRTGFVAGAGVEYGMTEALSAKFEYDFYDFGTSTLNFINTTLPAPGLMPVAIQSQVHSFTVGLNYRFNWVGGWH